MKTKYFIFLLLVLPAFSMTQNPDDKDRKVKLDSLERAFFSAKEDTTKRNRLDDLMDFYAADPATSPEESFRQLQLLVQKKGDPELNYLLLLYRVFITHTNDSIIETRKYLNEFLEQCHFHNDKTTRYITGLMILSSTEIYAGNYDDALRLLLIALDFARDTLKDKEMIAGTYLQLGILYNGQRDTLKAIEFNKKALEIETEINSTDNMASVSHNLAMQYSDLGQYDSAKFYFTESIRLFHINDKDARLRKPLINLGEVFRITHEYDSAIFYMRNGIRNAIEVNDEESLGEGYWYIAKTFQDIGKSDSAKKYFQLAKENIERLQPQAGGVFFYPDLARFYAWDGDYKLAYEFLQKAMEAKDLVFNAENNKVLKEMDAKYQAGRKEQEILKQEEQIKRQRILNYSMIAIAIFFLLLIFFIYRSNRLKQKSNKLLAVAKEKAEQSEKFKQQFLANMSHEIRTPMNAVMGMTNLVLDTSLNSKQKFYLEGIKNSSETLLYIINDILDLSKIEAGKIELEKIDFSIRDMAEQVKQTLHHKAEEKGLEFITDIDSKIPDVLVGDPTRLNQVLMNLAGNAIKFTEKGSVTIEIKKTSYENVIRFSIIDTGIGIPQDKLQTVFESFSQAHSSDTRKFGGTGLGLTISRQLVEMMGGKISIDSEEGAGAAFSFEINCPVGSKERLNEQKSSEQIDGTILNGLKILVVDDNEYNRVVVHDTLMPGVEITQAANGKETIGLIAQKDFDVILMDIQMPLMNGYEATRHIREKFDAPKNQIPVIALTASVVRSDLDKCRTAGMNDYVPKPFKASQLISAIAKATGRELKFAEKKNNGIIYEPGNHSPVTNLAYLTGFCEGDKERMRKYVSMFLDAAPSLVEKINTALAKNDFKEIARQIHSYKTKWIMMGMKETNNLAVKIEQQCRLEPESKSVKENTTKLLDQIHEAVNELNKA
ncbi:MAG: ATP-binding protein [Bacteroidia bacterium]